MSIKLVPIRPEWGEQDAAEMRAFVASPFGQKTLNVLLFSRPEVSGYEPEKRRAQSDERAGFEECIATLLSLAQPTK